MNRRSLTTAVLGAGLLVAGTGLAAGRAQQPGATQPPPTGTGQQPQQPLDAKGLRKLIDARLEEHRQGAKRLEEAMKKLDEGGDPAAIGRELMEQFRESRRGAGPGNRGGAGGGERRSSEFDLTGPKLSPDEHEKVRELLAQKHRELLDKVTELGAGNKELTERLIDGVGGRARWLEPMREKDPEEFSLRVKDLSTGLDVLKLGRVVIDAKKRGDTGVESAARGQLRTAMEARFDTRQQLSRLKLTQLRKQAEELEQSLSNNDKNRDTVVGKRTDEFLRLMENREKKGGPEAPHKP